MATQQRSVEVFVELADTLVDDYDVIDFLHTLTELPSSCWTPRRLG